MRSYFSAYLLWDAMHQTALARQIEGKHEGRSRFDMRHRGFVLSSVIASVGFLEAMINELFQDAFDGHTPAGAGVEPLPLEARQRMNQYWVDTRQGRTEILDKYQALVEIVGVQRMPHGEAPYQDAATAIGLRNAIVHFRAQDLSPDEPRFDRSRRGSGCSCARFG